MCRILTRPPYTTFHLLVAAIRDLCVLLSPFPGWAFLIALYKDAHHRGLLQVYACVCVCACVHMWLSQAEVVVCPTLCRAHSQDPVTETSLVSCPWQASSGEGGAGGQISDQLAGSRPSSMFFESFGSGSSYGSCVRVGCV